MASLVAQMVKNLPSVQEIWVRSPDQEDPLEKGKATQYSCLENPHGQRSLGGYSPWGRKESDTTEWLAHTSGDNLSTWGSERLKFLLKVTQLEMSLVLSLPDPGWRPDSPASKVPFTQLDEPRRKIWRDFGKTTLSPVRAPWNWAKSLCCQDTSSHLTWGGDWGCSSPLPLWWNHSAAPGGSLSPPCLPAYCPWRTQACPHCPCWMVLPPLWLSKSTLSLPQLQRKRYGTESEGLALTWLLYPSHSKA